MPKYIYYLFQTINWRKYNEASGVPSLTASTIENIVVQVPDLETQEKIVAIFEKWDAAINNLKLQIAQEQTVRSAVIQNNLKKINNMQCDKVKLSKLLVERCEYATKSTGLEHVSLTKKGIIAKGDRYNRDFLVKDDKTKKYKITKLNDICYNPANLKFGVICKNNYGDGIFSPIYITFECRNIEPDFLSYIVTSSQFIKHALKYEQGTVYERMSVSPSDLLSISVNIPGETSRKKLIDTVNAQDQRLFLLRQKLSNYESQRKYLLNRLLSGKEDI